MVTLGSGPDGTVSADGRVFGTYVHGLFGSDHFRAAFLGGFGRASGLAYEATVERTLDALAAHLEAAIDVAALQKIAETRARTT